VFNFCFPSSHKFAYLWFSLLSRNVSFGRGGGKVAQITNGLSFPVQRRQRLVVDLLGRQRLGEHDAASLGALQHRLERVARGSLPPQVRPRVIGTVRVSRIVVLL
jgi:hypothetical protein